MTHLYPITRYLNVTKAYGPTFSADGQRLAFLCDLTGVPQVWEIPAASGGPHWPEQRTFEADRVSLAQYAPRGDALLYARDAGGNEKAQFFLLAADNVETPLTAGYEAAMHTFGAWSADGRRFLFAANRRHPARFDLYVQPLDGPATLIWQNDVAGYLLNAEFSPDEQRVIVTRMHSSFDHALFESDLTTGAAHQLLADHSGVRYDDVAYTADRRGLLIITDLDSDFLYLACLDIATETLTRLVAPPWDCGDLALAPDRQTLAYTVNADGASELHVYDLRTGADRVANLGPTPGVVLGHPRFAPDGARLAFAFTSAVRPLDVYVWDLAADIVAPVPRASHGGLPTDTFRVPTLIHYPTFDQDAAGAQRMIPAWYYSPENYELRITNYESASERESEKADRRISGSADPHNPQPTTHNPAPSTQHLFQNPKSKIQNPVIVMVHGGPEGQSRPDFSFLTQYFLHHGFAVLVPNVRGSTGYGKAYSHLDDVEKRLDSVADLAHAVDWLRAQPDVDANRIIVYGGSYGGFMVLSAMTEYPDLWAAGVDIVGVSNFVTFLENTSDYRRAHREAEYGSLARDRDFLARISPATHLDRLAAPLIVIHGANDPRVPLSEAEQVVAALKARNIPVELIVFPDEGHGIVKRQNKLVAYPAIVAFLEKTIKGE